MIPNRVQTFVFITGLLFCHETGQAQSAVKDLISHKVRLNYTDHTVVTYVKPTSDIRVSNDLRYYWFSGQDIHSSQGGYSGKLLNGYYEDFYLNKNLREAGWFSKGLKYGLWKNWNEQGVLIEECSWSNGKKNGTYYRYDTQGKLKEKGRYANDSLRLKSVVKFMDTIPSLHPDTIKKTPKSLVPKFIKRIFKHRS